MFSDFNDELRILNTLKQWDVLSEKRISELSRLSHRRCSQTLDKLKQDRLVREVENRQSAKEYRITGSGMDRLDRVRRRERS